MIDLVFPHLLKSGHDVRKQPASHPYLRSVDANSAKLARVIDLENTPNGEGWVVFTGTARHSKLFQSAFQSNRMWQILPPQCEQLSPPLISRFLCGENPIPVES